MCGGTQRPAWGISTMIGISFPAGALTMNGASMPLGPWMRARVRGHHLVVGDVRVDLGRAEVRVPEHGLDGPEVGSPPKQVCCERMTQLVGGKRGHDAGACGVALEKLPEPLPAKPPSSRHEEARGRRGSERPGAHVV